MSAFAVVAVLNLVTQVNHAALWVLSQSGPEADNVCHVCKQSVFLPLAYPRRVRQATGRLCWYIAVLWQCWHISCMLYMPYMLASDGGRALHHEAISHTDDTPQAQPQALLAISPGKHMV